MKKPKYSNCFTVAANPESEETIIGFSFQYPKVPYSKEDLETEIVTNELTTVVLSKENAISLYKTLENVIENAYAKEE